MPVPVAEINHVLKEYEEQLLKDGIPQISPRGFDVRKSHSLYENLLSLRYPISVGGLIEKTLAEDIAKELVVKFEKFHTWDAEDTTETHYQDVFSICIVPNCIDDVKASAKEVRDAAMTYRDSINKLVKLVRK